MDRIPLKSFLKTLSDHDISFGRAYVNLSDFENALKWFRSFCKQNPFQAKGLALLYQLQNPFYFETFPAGPEND